MAKRMKRLKFRLKKVMIPKNGLMGKPIKLIRHYCEPVSRAMPRL